MYCSYRCMLHAYITNHSPKLKTLYRLVASYTVRLNNFGIRCDRII